MTSPAVHYRWDNQTRVGAESVTKDLSRAARPQVILYIQPCQDFNIFNVSYSSTICQYSLFRFLHSFSFLYLKDLLFSNSDFCKNGALLTFFLICIKKNTYFFSFCKSKEVQSYWKRKKQRLLTH